MNTLPESRTPMQSERIYVDFRIQMRMLIALVTLETLLIGGGVWYLYSRFKVVIEENLYRIHHTSQDVFTLLLDETGRVITIMLIVNLAGLLIADRLWVWYVRRILNTFTALAGKVTDLDFCPDRESPDQHAALDLMLEWRRKERERGLLIRSIVKKLDSDNQTLLASQLQELRLHLPPYSRRFVGRSNDAI